MVETLAGDDVVARFVKDSAELDAAIRTSPVLSPFFGGSARDVSLPAAYCAYLKMTQHYVRWTVPMLRAAARSLRAGDEDDRRWSAVFGGDADEETDVDAGTGHDAWAADDMRAVGAPAEFVAAPFPDGTSRYKAFFIDEVAQHPYAALGAKGVLEHTAITTADDFATGLRGSAIDNIENGVRFIAGHGVLDVDHVREGDALIRSMTSPNRLRQILEGAEVTRVSYVAFLRAMEDVYAEWAPRWPQ